MTHRKPIAVYESGNSNGTPILLIHGGGGGVWNWSATVENLADYRCIMPELPEHGSSRHNGPFTIHSTAEEIIHYIRANVPGGKVHLVGASVGGQVALEILARAPETVMSALISGTLALPIPGYRLGLFSETNMSLLYRFFIKPWRWSNAWVRLMMKTMADLPEAYFELVKQDIQNLTLDSWTHTMSEFYRYRLPASIRKVKNPVLLVAGEHETVEVQPTHRMLQQVLPNSCSVILGKGQNWSAAREHNWAITLPDLCARTIRSWINQTALPEGLVEVPC